MVQRELELLRPLGQGGFGTVWLARLRGRDGFTRRVAVKLMKEAGAPADVIARQRDEARLLGLLQHPNIVQVYDLSEHQGLPAVVMEFVEGVDLSTMIRSFGALPIPCAVEAASYVAAALDAGWSAPCPETGRPLRVIHRDIKPANVLLTLHGAVKVLDFGVARADFDREGQTQSMAFGTPRFMAPEQFLGGTLTPANDVYALGVTLWELTQGHAWERPPLAEERFVEKVTAQVAAAPASLRPLLARMLAWDQTERPTAREVGAELDALAPPGERLRTWAAREVPGVMATHAAMLSDSFVAQSSGGLAPAPVAPPVPDSGSSLVTNPPTPPADTSRPRRTLPLAALAAGIALVAVLGVGGIGLTSWWWLGGGRPAEGAPASPANGAPGGDGLVAAGPGAPSDGGSGALQPSTGTTGASGGAGGLGVAPGQPSVPTAAGGATVGATSGEGSTAPSSSRGTANGGRTAGTNGAGAHDSDRAGLIAGLQAAGAGGSDPGGGSGAVTMGSGAPESPGGSAASGSASERGAPTAGTTGTGTGTLASAPPPIRAPVSNPAGSTIESAPEAPASPESAVHTRSLRVLADVIGATVHIDGSVVGTTPLPARTLGYGDHVVEVEAGGVLAHRTITLDGTSPAVLRYLSKEKRWVWE